MAKKNNCLPLSTKRGKASHLFKYFDYGKIEWWKDMTKIMIGKPLFENIFGENTIIKVIDFLYMGKDFDFTLTHISNGTGLSRTAVRKSLNFLLENGLAKVSREDTKSTYYCINKKNDKYNLLESLYNKVKKEIVTA